MDLESRIVSPDPAVCDLIGRVDWIVNAIKEDAGIFHVVREVTDLDLGSDELLWAVIGNTVDGDTEIIVYGAGDAVLETFMEPFTGPGFLHMVLSPEIPVQRSLAGSGMHGCVVLPDVGTEAFVELLQRVDLREVQDIEPAHLQSSEVPLNLSLGGSVPDGRMDFHDAQGIQDVDELPVRVGAAVIEVEFIRKPIGGDRLPEDLLVDVCVVIVEDLTADDHPGVVIDDHDHIGPPLLSILRNGRKIARVRLPQTTEFMGLKCLAVFDIRVACAFQVIGLDEPLYGTLADASIDKAILNQETVDHHSGDAGYFSLIR